MAGGATADEALEAVVVASDHAAYRQVLIVDAQGRAAAHSGVLTLGRHAHATGPEAAAAGNLLATESVPEAMLETFTSSASLTLSARLVHALRAGLLAGGEEGDVHSAGLMVVDSVEWPVTDLRVDWSQDPVTDLEDLLEIWMPQAEDYVTRALDPRQAPSFGVPGDQ